MSGCFVTVFLWNIVNWNLWPFRIFDQEKFGKTEILCYKILNAFDSVCHHVVIIMMPLTFLIILFCFIWLTSRHVMYILLVHIPPSRIHGAFVLFRFVLWGLTWNKTKTPNKLSRVRSTDWKSSLKSHSMYDQIFALWSFWLYHKEFIVRVNVPFAIFKYLYLVPEIFKLEKIGKICKLKDWWCHVLMEYINICYLSAWRFV